MNDTAADILSRRRALSTDELARVRETRDRLLRQLRVQLRCVVARLARDRRFAVFTRPVHPEEAPDYLEVIRCPMDLGSVRDKIDNHQYTSVKEFAAVRWLHWNLSHVLSWSTPPPTSSEIER